MPKSLVTAGNVTPMKKTNFVRDFKGVVIRWAEKHKDEILNYRTYRWKNQTYEGSVESRNGLEEKIRLSRRENDGGIDLGTVDEIHDWGFGKKFPLRNEKEVIKATKEAFEFLDRGDCYQATKRLMWISGVGPAAATKILGLSDHENLCIYDSRVGSALSDLRKGGAKVILCPPGRGRSGDYVSPSEAHHVWAENYERLLWTLEIIQEHFRKESSKPRVVDIEMALFMMGR